MGNLWLLLAMAVFVGWALWRSAPVLPADFWWHLRAGEDILRQGAIPRVDTYSWTFAGQTFYDQPWLAQVVFALLYRAGGLALIIVVNALLITTAGGLLARTAIRAGASRQAAAVALILGGAPIMSHYWLVRPQSFAYPLFAAMLLLVTSSRLTWVHYAFAALITAAWSNLHGSFVLGPAIALATVVHAGGIGLLRTDGERWQRLRSAALLLACSALGTLVNPRGWGIYGYVRDLTTNIAVRSLVDEWAPTSLTEVTGQLLVLLVIATILVAALRRQWPNTLNLAVAMGFLVLAATAYRHIVWFAMSAMPVLAVALGTRRARAPAGDNRVSAVAGTALGVVMLVAVILSLPFTRIATGNLPDFATAIPSKTTLAALDRLQPDRMFNESGYGSHLIWLGHDVFFDPRFEFYPTAHVADYVAISRAENLTASIERWKFDAMLISKSGQPALVRAMTELPGWELVAQDGDAVLFKRQS